MGIRTFLLIGAVLVFCGYRMGNGSKSAPKRHGQAPAAAPKAQPQPSAAPRPPAPAKREWLSVKTLLVVVIILLVIAIFSSLQR